MTNTRNPLAAGNGWRAGRFGALLLLALSVALSAGRPALAQGQPKPNPAPAAQIPICETLVDPLGTDALRAARQRLLALWLEHGGSHFASYSMAGEQRNPFDRQAGPLMGGRDGVVEALVPRCLVEASGDGRSYRFRFVAPYYRFHEAAAGWSRPMRDGLMLAVSLEREGETWRELPVGEAPTILVAEQAPRRAVVEQLPKTTRWREPLPPCAKGTKWTGMDCVSTRRARKS